MTPREELWVQVARHLMRQGHRSLNAAHSSCAYRSPDGSSCAVGCLIRDEHYLPEIEGETADGENVVRAVQHSLGRELSRAEICDLMELQDVHDHYVPDDWPRTLQRKAHERGVSDDVLRAAGVPL